MIITFILLESGGRIECIRFVDDMGLLIGDLRTFNGMVRDVSRTSEELGMKINIKKAKSMVINKISRIAQVKIANEKTEQVTVLNMWDTWLERT